MTTPTVSLSPTHALTMPGISDNIYSFLDAPATGRCFPLNKIINTKVTNLLSNRVREETNKKLSNAEKILTFINDPNLYRLPQEVIDKALSSVNASRADLQEVFNTSFYRLRDLDEHFNTRPHFKFPTIFRKFVIEKIQRNHFSFWKHVRVEEAKPLEYFLWESQDQCIQVRALYWEAYFQGQETANLHESNLYGGWDAKELGDNNAQAIVIAAKRVPTLRRIDLSSVFGIGTYNWSEREFETLKKSGKIVDARATLRTYSPKAKLMLRIAALVLLIACIVLYTYLVLHGIAIVSPTLAQYIWILSTEVFPCAGFCFSVICMIAPQKIMSRIHNCRRIYTPPRV